MPGILSDASKVLVINSGSSSLKYKLFDAVRQGTLAVLASGLVERIGEAKSIFNFQALDKPKETSQDAIPDHTVALSKVIDVLQGTFSNSVSSEMRAVGHRVVHGGPKFHKASVVNPQVLAAIKEVSSLAPLHNPPNLMGIEAASKVFSCPQVAVFDTAFHMTMPPSSFMYALPYEIYEKHNIRKYGFHGTSYKYLTEQAAAHLGKDVSEVNLIACHLGAGSSMCCIKNGQSVDTTMGVTPLEGLVMASRCGDLDPAAVLYMVSEMGMSPAEVDNLMNKKSGLVGVCGEKDFRSILQGIAAGDKKAELAHDLFVQRVRRYLGSYLVQLGGQVDAVVFSAGIGENAASVRAAICSGLEGLGIEFDAGKNQKLVGGAMGEFQKGSSKIKLMVLPTDEELSIAQQALQEVDGPK